MEGLDEELLAFATASDCFDFFDPSRFETSRNVGLFIWDGCFGFGERGIGVTVF